MFQQIHPETPGFMDVRLPIFLFITISLWFAGGSAFTPEDNYLINCGSPTNTTIGGRTFAADASTSPMLSTPVDISAATTTTPNSVIAMDNSALYQTARIFTGPSSYTFAVRQPGRHFIRLYFFPFTYQSYRLTAASFAVSTQSFVLLDNFQPNNASAAVFKEFSMNITSATLILSFTPAANSSLAFVNAIEVVSVPDDLIVDTAPLVPSGLYRGLSAQALETTYRINMGGPNISSAGDTLGRTWQSDDTFLFNKNLSLAFVTTNPIVYRPGGATEETAPELVYSTATELGRPNQLTQSFKVIWEFDVESSSVYFIRFHFCDIVSKAINLLYFDVAIGNSTVIVDLDLSARCGQRLRVPYFVDFVSDAIDPSGKLRVSISPSVDATVPPNAILNGLEIMKTNIFANDRPAAAAGSSGSKTSLAVVLGSVFGAVAVLIVAAFLYILLRRRRVAGLLGADSWLLPFSTDGGGPVSYRTGSSHGNGAASFQLSFAVLQEATNDFDECLVIGVGGFGKVYKGAMKDDTIVAVKRGNPWSGQGLNEFHAEIELLSRLRHRHLVSLIGYCNEENEMILVYEYMQKGSLKNHLYGEDLPHLTWKQRLDICIGAAKGLHYLHTGSAKPIIHRDVKSGNILLDEDLMAKVADFGLSRTGPEMDQTHVSTAVKGSFGYLDPEYFRRQQLTYKSDVYSFGVVLLEVLCARPVIDPTLPREMVNLAEWGLDWQRRGELQKIVDPRIAGTINTDSLRKFGETAEQCLAETGAQRPTMSDVLWNLEYALQLQEGVSANLDMDSINQIAQLTPQKRIAENLLDDDDDDETVQYELKHVEGAPGINQIDQDTGIDRDIDSLELQEFDYSLKSLTDISTSKVFSQLISSEGR